MRRGMYVVSVFFLVLLAGGYLLGVIVPNGKPAPHLERTMWTEVFTFFYISAMVWAGINFARAYSRMLTRSGRRRIRANKRFAQMGGMVALGQARSDGQYHV